MTAIMSNLEFELEILYYSMINDLIFNFEFINNYVS